MDYSLRKRVKKLEASKAAPGNAERKARALALRLGQDPETLLRLVRGHEAMIEREVDDDGYITLSGLQFIIELGRAEKTEAMTPAEIRAGSLSRSTGSVQPFADLQP